MSKEDSNPTAPTVLNIPRVPMTTTGAASNVPDSDQDNSNADFDNLDETIGEFDDGKSGKLTLSTLIQEGLIEPGDGVMTIDYLGQTFKV